jgi:hypothetical protein
VSKRISIDVNKAPLPGFEKLKQCDETDNCLRCLTVFILGNLEQVNRKTERNH